MRTVTFYRISTGSRGELFWRKIADYSTRAQDDTTAVERATRRMQRERRVSDWEQVADICVVRET